MKKFISFMVFIVLVVLLIGCSKNVENMSMEEISRDFISLLAHGEYRSASGYFDMTMKMSLPPVVLKPVWEQSNKGMGRFRQFESVMFDSTKDDYTRYIASTQFDEGIIDYKIIFNSEKKIAGFFYSISIPEPDYADKSLFTEEEIVIGNGDWELPGTLTLPKKRGIYPCLILVHGSGPNNRDETNSGSKIFRDIAWGLASNGIAVLRYDKWSYVIKQKSDIQKKYTSFTVEEEVLKGARYAVDFALTNPNIDKQQIYVLGHSQGGGLIPRIADQNSDAAGFICLSGNYRSLIDLMVEQYDYLVAADGKIGIAEKFAVRQMKKQAKLINSDRLTEKTPLSKLPSRVPAVYWIDLNNYDKCGMAKQIERPLLVLQGERDYQVTMQDYNGWKTCLEGVEWVTFKSYPGLNHVFVWGDTPSIPEEYNRPSLFNIDVLTDIEIWIKSNQVFME